MGVSLLSLKKRSAIIPVGGSLVKVQITKFPKVAVQSSGVANDYVAGTY